MKNIAPIPLVLDVDKYGGKWIATFRGHIVASAASFAAANALLDSMGFGDDVILTRVPRSGDFVL